MAKESLTTQMIKRIIEDLPPMAREQCEELAAHIRNVIEQAGYPVGPLAIALVGSEMEDAAE